MTDEPLIGISLGHSMTVVCVYRGGHPVPIPDPESKTPLIPSVVALRRGNLETGHRAEWREPQIRKSQREMGSETVYELGDRRMRPQDVAAEVLKKAKANAELSLGMPVRRAVVTVPASFGDREREATREAIRLAGLECIRLLDEPVAAALAHGFLDADDRGRLLVFDWDEDRVVATIVETSGGRIEIRASTEDKFLGGKDLDGALSMWAGERFAREHPGALVSPVAQASLRRACKEAKETLSSAPSTEIVVAGYAQDGNGEMDLEIQITREEFGTLIAPLVKRAMAIVDKAFGEAGLSCGDVAHALPIGGTTWAPNVREALRAHVPSASLVVGTVDPELAIASGAAVSASLPARSDVALGNGDKPSSSSFDDERMKHLLYEPLQELEARDEPTPSLINCYEVLGVSPQSSPEEIRRAWAKQVREYSADADPERNGLLNEARRVLLDSEMRAIHDAELLYGAEMTVLRERAREAVARQDPNGLVDALRELLAYHPSDQRVRAELGFALRAARRYPEALKVLRAIVAEAPGSDEALYNLGATLRISGDPHSAREILERALDPDQPKVRIELARTYLDEGNFVGAVQTLEQGLAPGTLKPDDLDLLLELVLVYTLASYGEGIVRTARRIGQVLDGLTDERRLHGAKRLAIFLLELGRRGFFIGFHTLIPVLSATGRGDPEIARLATRLRAMADAA